MTSFLRWSIAHARRTKEPWNTLLRCWNDNVTYTNGCVLISGIQYVHLTNLYAAVPGRKTLQPKFSIMAVEIGSDQGQTEPKIPFGHWIRWAPGLLFHPQCTYIRVKHGYPEYNCYIRHDSRFAAKFRRAPKARESYETWKTQIWLVLLYKTHVYEIRLRGHTKMGAQYYKMVGPISLGPLTQHDRFRSLTEWPAVSVRPWFRSEWSLTGDHGAESCAQFHRRKLAVELGTGLADS